jgi:hypothetical protein
MKVRVIKFLNSFFKKPERQKCSVDYKELNKMIDSVIVKLSEGCCTPILERESNGLTLKLSHHKYYHLELNIKDKHIAAIEINSGNIALFFKQNKKEIQDKLFIQIIEKLTQLY